jgi:hypothetical protein
MSKLIPLALWARSHKVKLSDAKNWVRNGNLTTAKLLLVPTPRWHVASTEPVPNPPRRECHLKKNR